ncbi:MAG: tRNA (N6-isopentenyl adenosine(37)-C2)-methylthiotransferase MiaB [Candidatus Bipolaricaulota bacterium]
MANKKVFIETWGCQLNYHRSEKIAGTLSDNEYNVVDNPGEADLIIFNTCAVRGKSEEKVLGRIGQIKSERKEDSVLGVGGCMAQHLGPDLFKISDGVDFIFGTSNISEILELSDKATREDNIHSVPDPGGFEELPALRNQDHFAWVTIAEGCSNACSYCIVPQVRGPLRSRPPKQIFEEIEHLVQDNYKEIQLLGQNVNAFGQDIDEEDMDFAWLLKKVAEMGVPRISFTTPHPGDLKVKTLTVMRKHPNIVRHIHLPLQSGSNRILQIMNRDYTREEYLEKIEQARSIDPQVNITTDIIVGHPGETEKDFQKTLDVMKRVKFGSIYVAQFSPRPDTLSASMEDNVPEEEKKKRLQLVLDRQKKYSKTVEPVFNGRSAEVLVEGMAREDGKVYGKNEFGKTVTFDGNKSMIGQFERVKYPAPEGKTCKVDI